MNMRVTLRWALGFAILGRSLGAQEWPARLASPTRDTLTRLADSARAVGLPTEAIVAKAAEGVLKGADDARIVRAARALVARLGEARATLPVTADRNAVVAGASALQVGVSSASLRRIATSASSAEGMLAALVTVSDLVSGGVPEHSAVGSVDRLLLRGASIRDLAAFRASVSESMQAGQPPASAVDVGEQAALRSLGAGRTPPPRVP